MCNFKYLAIFLLFGLFNDLTKASANDNEQQSFENLLSTDAGAAHENESTRSVRQFGFFPPFFGPRPFFGPPPPPFYGPGFYPGFRRRRIIRRRHHYGFYG